jgi:hypothetical protein
MYIKSVGSQLMRDNNNTKERDSQEVFVKFSDKKRINNYPFSAFLVLLIVAYDKVNIDILELLGNIVAYTNSYMELSF